MGLHMKRQLMQCLAWPEIAVYGYDSWTLMVSDKKRITAFEMTAYRRIMRVSWREHSSA